MLDRDQVGAGRDFALDADADAEDVAHEPMVELDPAQHHRLGGAPPEQARDDPDQDPNDRRRIEDRGVKQRPEQRRHRSTHTARRRRRYLSYSPNKVTKLGSVRTASVVSLYLPPSPFPNS